MKRTKNTHTAAYCKTLAILLLTTNFLLSTSSDSAAAETWDPVIVPRGEYREQLSQTPIVERPGRPLHVYGNTVRYFHSIRQPNATTIARRPLRQIIVGVPRGASLRQARLIRR